MKGPWSSGPMGKGSGKGKGYGAGYGYGGGYEGYEGYDGYGGCGGCGGYGAAAQQSQRYGPYSGYPADGGYSSGPNSTWSEYAAGDQYYPGGEYAAGGQYASGSQYSTGQYSGYPGDQYSAAGGMWQEGSGYGETEKDMLVRSIKDIQRRNPAGKEQWERFADATRMGSRDPSRHPAEHLRGFLQVLEEGKAPEQIAGTLGSSRYVRLRGVPFQAEHHEVVEFLSSYSVPATSVAMGMRPDGRITGEAYVMFKSVEEAESALANLQNREIQGRYIELFRSTEEDFQRQAGISAAAPVAIADQKENLVFKIKQIQRSGPEAKVMWAQYCESTRTGNHDPARHTEESLKAFIEAYERGEAPESAAQKVVQPSRVLRLRGVPFQANADDIVGFLPEFGIGQSQITLSQGPGGRHKGEAYVQFASIEDAERALQTKQRQEIQGRYIELFRSSQEEFDRNLPFSAGGPVHPEAITAAASKDELVMQVKRIQRAHEDGKTKWEEFCTVLRTGNRDPARHTSQALKMFLEAFERGEVPKEPIYSNVLRLRGVPFQSELSDVVGFLAEYGIDEQAVVLGRGPDGKKTGEAYVTMASVEIAEKALEEKQKQEIHGRYIELFRACPEDRDEAKVYHEAFLRMHGGAADAINKEALVAEVKHIQRSSEDGRMRWEKFCDALRTANRDPLRHTNETLRAFVQAFKNGEDLVEVALFLSKDSSVVRLRGVPFQGGVNDIVQFLSDYNIREHDITFMRKPDGRHSGEAIIVFPNAELAQRAIDEKQRHEIQGRYIELFRSTRAELDECKQMTAVGPPMHAVPPMQTGKEAWGAQGWAGDWSGCSGCGDFAQGGYGPKGRGNQSFADPGYGWATSGKGLFGNVGGFHGHGPYGK